MTTRQSFRVALLMAAAISIQAQSIITTVAGRGRVLTGLGGPATAVPLANPQGIALDAKGNLYIADNTHHVILRVDANGVATVFAGSGSPGFSGDGGPATAASLREPWAVAADSTGNVYIADMRNERIRKVDRNGIITTIAGGGAAFQTDEIPATSQAIFEPFTVAVDGAGAVYFNDTGGAIRKVTPDGIVHTVVGSVGGSGFSGDGGPATKAQLGGPSGMSFDGSGNLYFADMNNNRIRKVDTKGNISTVAGNGQLGFSGDGGPATSASLYFPSAAAVDALGNLYIADQYNGCIRKVTPAGTITTVAGNHFIFPPVFAADGGSATATSLGQPHGIALDATGGFYILEQTRRRIRRVDASGIITTVAGNGAQNFAGDGGSATQAALDFPTGVKADNSGNLYVADYMNHRVRKIATNGTISTIAGNGTPGFSGDGGTATSAQLNNPVAVAIDSSGNVYICDQANARIRQVTPDGTITTYAGGGNSGLGDGGPAASASFFVPGGLAIDGADNLYVADNLNNRIRKITPQGTISTIAGNGRSGFSGDGGPALQAALNGPIDVAVDPAGNLYFIDLGNLRIRQVTPDGKIKTAGGLGYGGELKIEGKLATQIAMDFSWGIATDRVGNLYVSSGVYIYRINAAGVLTILVGAGLEGYQEGFDGDGGPAAAAHLTGENFPGLPHTGMGVGPDGSLYVADTGNDRIRKITNPGAPAQLVVENQDFPVPSSPYTVTGADQVDFFLAGPGGPGQDSQRLTISNAGTGLMDWTATTSTAGNIDWLHVSSASGSAPSTITVNADTTKLSPGFYWGTVLISAPKASNSPRYVSGEVLMPIPLLSPGSGTGTFVVNESPGVGWFASSDVGWLTITSTPSGRGLGSFTYAVAANPGTTQRSGFLTVGRARFQVTQAAQGPFIQAIVDAFDYTPGVAPGAWVTITGTNLATGSPQTWNLSGVQQLPTKLGGTTVTFNGAQAAIYYVSSTQINALVPASIAPGPVQVAVQVNGQNSPPFTITATATLPSIYAIPNSDGSAFFVTAALAGTGTLIGNSAVDPRVSRPALPGDVLDLYMAGLGATADPSQFITNQVFAGAYPVTAAVTARIGGKPALVLFAGLTSPGLYLVRIALPSDLPAGPQLIQVDAGGKQTRPSLMLMVGAP